MSYENGIFLLMEVTVATGSRSCNSNKNHCGARVPTPARLIDQLNTEWHGCNISMHDGFTNVM